MTTFSGFISFHSMACLSCYDEWLEHQPRSLDKGGKTLKGMIISDYGRDRHFCSALDDVDKKSLEAILQYQNAKCLIRHLVFQMLYRLSTLREAAVHTLQITELFNDIEESIELSTVDKAWFAPIV